jgi:hypothetical protein
MAPIVKFPVRRGEQWSGGPLEPRRRLRTLSVGQPCRGQYYASDDCLVIEDLNEATGLQTVTQYARRVGPVRYEHYRLGEASTKQPMQTLELRSYRLGIQ